MTAREIFLDPDGTLPPWMAVVIPSETGVRYVHQCGGTTTLERGVEGYLVPVGGAKVDVERGALSVDELRAPFHRGKRCYGDTERVPLEPEQIEQLRNVVEEIPWWSDEHDSDGAQRRDHLKLDTSRIGEAAEGWVPVLTSAGPGYLLWTNCD